MTRVTSTHTKRTLSPPSCQRRGRAHIPGLNPVRTRPEGAIKLHFHPLRLKILSAKSLGLQILVFRRLIFSKLAKSILCLEKCLGLLAFEAQKIVIWLQPPGGILLGISAWSRLSQSVTLSASVCVYIFLRRSHSKRLELTFAPLLCFTLQGAWLACSSTKYHPSRGLKHYIFTPSSRKWMRLSACAPDDELGLFNPLCADERKLRHHKMRRPDCWWAGILLFSRRTQLHQRWLVKIILH